MKTIIVPTDYSANAKNATKYAADLAQLIGARIILLHAFQRPALLYTSLEIKSIEELKMQHLERLQAMVEELHFPHQLQVEKTVAIGQLHEVLPDIVRLHAADLVVMGMQGKSFVEHVMVGSTTASVLRQATFPLLIIPVQTTFQPVKQMLFACEYHFLSGTNTLTLLKELALAFNAEIRIMHIEQPVPELVLKHERVDTGHHLERLLKGVKHQYQFISGTDISKKIEQEVHQNKPDVLVMVPRKHSAWDAMLNKSTTRKMAFLTQIPLLSLPN